MADHSTALAHQFDDLEQQLDCSTLGMWVFLITEIMFFGGLFTGYVIYRNAYPEAFAEASHHLDLLLGGINTVDTDRQQSDDGSCCQGRSTWQ